MSKRSRKPRAVRYADLGDLLRDWRRKRFRSALSMFKEAKLPVSYKVYADFERGATLPSIPVLVQLAKFFHQDPKTALFLWAAVQMPTPDLKKIFIQALRVEPKEPASKPTARTFENTWTLGARDKDILIKDPWLWDVICAIAAAYPNEIRLAELPIPKGKNRDALKPWIQDGHIEESKQGLRLKHPHVHIPKTADWNPVRVNNVAQASLALLERITPTLMEKGDAFRGLIDRGLSPKLAKAWAERMKDLENEFIALQEKSDEPASTAYTLLTLFGPNRLKP